LRFNRLAESVRFSASWCEKAARAIQRLVSVSQRLNASDIRLKGIPF
jgi:hypothetical protein